MTDFVTKTRNLKLRIKLTSDDLSQLSRLKGASFSRIDVSNVSNENYLGINKVLSSMAPLLSKTNPNAVLITTFMNWMNEAPKSFSKKFMERKMKEYKDRSNGMLLTPSFLQELMIKVIDETSESAPWFYNDSKDFDKFIKSGVQAADGLGLHRRSIHKIVPKRIGWSMDANKQDLLPEFSE